MVLFLLDRGLDVFQVGLVLAIYSATVILLELPTGGLADSIGRKRVYLISQGVYALALATILLAWNLPMIALAVMLMGTARALSSGSMDAWFVDEFHSQRPGQDLQRALAKANVFIPVGIALGSLIGGLLPFYLGDQVEAILGRGIYAINLLVMLLAVGLQVVMTAILVEEHRPKAPGGAWSGARQLPKVLSTSVRFGIRDRTVLLLLLSVAAMGFSLMAVEAYWQPRLKEILGGEVQTWWFGVLAAGYFLAGALGNLLSIPLCSRKRGSYGPILLGVRLLMGGVLVVLALQSTLLGFAALYLAFFLLIGVEGSPFATLFNAQVPSEKRSTLLSFQSLVLQVGGLIGTLSLGYVAQVYSIASAWTIAGLVLIISSVFYLGIVIKEGRSAKGKGSSSSP